MAKVVKKQEAPAEAMIIGRKNIILFLIGLLSIVMAFILMAQPPVDGFLSRTLAPVILVIAYLVIIPIAIFIRDKKTDKAES
ncbi:MAG: hypothetical protein JW956_02900 [Calditrichaceae bacterium]|nr:hypothetical protein [Calditrichaceae bacterium]